MTINKAEARRTIESLNAVGSQVDRGVRRVLEGEMPPEGENVLFWLRGSWRCGQWLRRDDGICWVVEGTSWVEPSVWDSRMQRPTHWMPQPEAPNVAIRHQ
jgi:hypothetical protein